MGIEMELGSNKVRSQNFYECVSESFHVDFRIFEECFVSSKASYCAS